MTYPEDNARKKSEKAEGAVRLTFAREIERESAEVTDDLKLVAKWLSDSYQNGTITEDDFFDARRRITRLSLGNGDAGDKVWLDELVREVKRDAFDQRAQARAVELFYGVPAHPQCRSMSVGIGWTPGPSWNMGDTERPSILQRIWQRIRRLFGIF